MTMAPEAAPVAAPTTILTVTQGAEWLRDQIREHGELDKEEAKAQLEQMGLPRNRIGAALGFGVNQRRRWYQLSGDSILPPSEPVEAPGQPAIADLSKVTIDTLESPREQMAALAVQLGFNAKTAHAMSNYLDTAFDVFDPAEVWKALQQVPSVHPAQRRQFWTSWTSLIGADPPEDLKARVRSEAPLPSERRHGTNGHKPGRLYVAIDGEVMPVDGDDEGGLSYAMALQQARLQIEKESRNGHNDNGDVVAAMIHESGENSRQMLSLVAERNGNGHGSSDMDTILKMMELQREASDARMQTQIDAITSSHERQMDRLTEGIEALAQNAKRGPFDELDNWFPGAKEKLTAGMFGGGNGSNGASGVRINLPQVTDAEGNAIGVDLEAYKVIKDIEQRDQMISTVRQTMPQFLTVGMRIAKAIEKTGGIPADAQDEEPTQTRQPEGTIAANCANPDCAKEIYYRNPESKAIRCPYCDQVTNPQSGRQISEPVPRASAEDEPAEDPGAGQPAGAATVDPPGDEEPPAAVSKKRTRKPRAKKPVGAGAE